MERAMDSAFLLVLCALFSCLSVATTSSSLADHVAAEQQSCQSSSCALELLQRSALAFNKAHLASSVPKPNPGGKKGKITTYMDSECTEKEGSSMKVSLETDECLLDWNYTCACSPSNEKIVIGHRYKNGCGDRSMQHVREMKVGRCIPGNLTDSDAQTYVKVDDFGTCPCCGNDQKCSVYGDPHITVFDQAEVSLLNIEGLGIENDVFGHGDYWLVKSNLIHVQGRYRKVIYPKARFQGNSFLTGVAIGGPFLEGNVLLIGPRDTGRVQLVNAAGEVQEILKDGGMYKDNANLIEAHYREHSLMVKDSTGTTPGVYFHFPSGVKVEVNRYGKHIDFSITMAPDVAGGPIDGQCGNFNGNPADDSAGLIAARMGYEIPRDELLFLDEGKDEDDNGEDELTTNSGRSSNGLSVLEASEMSGASKSEVRVMAYADSKCEDVLFSESDLELGPELCDYGWNFTCACDGPKRAVLAQRHWPACGPESYADGGEIQQFKLKPNKCYPPAIDSGINRLDMTTKYWKLVGLQACPCCEESAKCTLHGDPHITVFDKGESKVLGLLGAGSRSTHARHHENGEDITDMFGWGDFWLVKSEQVLIQARYRKVYYPNAVEPLNHSYLTSVAVAGPFMRGHKIIVEPRNGLITWSLGAVHKPILHDGKEDSTFKVEDDIKGRYHNRTSLVPGTKPVVPGVDLELPSDVKMSVDRFGKHLDLEISMTPSSGGPGGIDGQCGNYNGDASDDTAELINTRIGYQVPLEESLFERDPLDMQA